ncbi:phosphatase PAP2 family protein [Bacillus suaedaesalsae]|uniref:Phosphatase PAP2 family protein n=1 Tax=Bacillus suaedaesalsae TaxID=2810349 RepID=A0ABS2DPD4_9BACI|nr:phosphatase PAP2 family protein [Bacillus suaedaesalsae]MBM6619526.1 phosphatase PAP2 family protein [Bacillus suaedaesalsae]
MINKWVHHMYQFECGLFLTLNRRFDRAKLNWFFRFITHIGGARITIGATAMLIIFLNMPYQLWAMQSGISLVLSHLVVVLFKKLYPRNRPYLSVIDARVVDNPLRDYSFPSGHTTAIFSIITPYVLHMPLLSLLLYPLAVCVGLSRIFLGLHYPSDVFVGCIVGSLFGFLVVFFY